MEENAQQINLADWYSAKDAADRLTRNSGKEVKPSYARKLAQYGKIRTLKISERNVLYRKEDIDAYIVEDRGDKSARAKRIAAKPRAKKTGQDKPAA